MKILRMFAIVLLGFALTGCGAALEHWENQNNFTVSANELDPALISNDALQNASNNTKTYVGLIVNNSESKCSKFVNGLVLASNTTNTGLDMMTTVFSALGTAFTPVATIHALTASATISSGWKTAINSDIYAKATIANYAQAIQATYYTDLGSYMTALTTMPDAQVIASLEVAKIRSIHKECSLASAQATISATLTPSAQPGTPNTVASEILSVTGAIPVGTTVTLTGVSSAINSNNPVSVTYTVKAGDNATAIAKAVLDAVNAEQKFKDANVSAAQANSPANNVIVLSSPTASAVKWSATPAANITLAAGGVPAVTPPSRAPSTTPSGVTQGGVPGSKIK